MTILITGGAGFIGSALAKKLVAMGYEIIIVDNFNSYYNPKLKKDRLKYLLNNYKYKLNEQMSNHLKFQILIEY